MHILTRVRNITFAEVTVSLWFVNVQIRQNSTLHELDVAEVNSDQERRLLFILASRKFLEYLKNILSSV